LLINKAEGNVGLVALNIDYVDLDQGILTVDKHSEYHSTQPKSGRKNGNETLIPLDDEAVRVLRVYLATRPAVKKTNALFVSYAENRLHVQEVSKLVKEWSIKTGVGPDSNDTSKKIVPHFFRAWGTYMLQINGCNPIVIDAIRGDKATTMRGFYANQVLPF
jgi:integrase